jgi:amino-acid N-acetyltransferase
MEDIRFESATPADLPAVRTLLERCDLPTEDLQPQHLEHFVVCREAGQLVGTVGLELHGDAGLLRSLAVVPERRGKGVGHELWARVRAQAARVGIGRLYLLTTTADGLFSRWGFERVARDAVPRAIQATPEYSALCPSTAVVMAIDVAPVDQRVL